MMMAKKVEDRYRSAEDLIEDLDLIARGEPPHFAHRTFDHEAITDIVTDVVSQPTLPTTRVESIPQRTSGPVSTVVLVVLAASMLVNLILLAILLSS